LEKLPLPRSSLSASGLRSSSRARTGKRRAKRAGDHALYRPRLGSVRVLCLALCEAGLRLFLRLASLVGSSCPGFFYALGGAFALMPAHCH
jgi:hypothetical protein